MNARPTTARSRAAKGRVASTSEGDYALTPVGANLMSDDKTLMRWSTGTEWKPVANFEAMRLTSATRLAISLDRKVARVSCAGSADSSGRERAERCPRSVARRDPPPDLQRVAAGPRRRSRRHRTAITLDAGRAILMSDGKTLMRRSSGSEWEAGCESRKNGTDGCDAHGHQPGRKMARVSCA